LICWSQNERRIPHFHFSFCGRSLFRNLRNWNTLSRFSPRGNFQQFSTKRDRRSGGVNFRL
jgi:hypothetical protein